MTRRIQLVHSTSSHWISSNDLQALLSNGWIQGALIDYPNAASFLSSNVGESNPEINPSGSILGWPKGLVVNVESTPRIILAVKAKDGIFEQSYSICSAGIG